MGTNPHLDDAQRYRCSVCGFVQASVGANFVGGCPDCGAWSWVPVGD